MQNKWRAFSRWVKRKLSSKLRIVSLHIRSMWETTVMHKQVSGRTVNFGPNSPVYPFLELNSGIPPPHFGKLQIWDDQSLLQNTPPILENFRFGMTKVYSGIPPPFRKTSDLGWPKFTPEYPPILGKFQIWDDQSLLRNTPPFWKISDLGWPKFTPEYPPPFRKTSDLGWPKFTPEYPPPPFWKTSDLGWPKFTSEYPPPREFQNTESYYMWRLYPTQITTSLLLFHVKGGRIVNMSSTKNYLV